MTTDMRRAQFWAQPVYILIKWTNYLYSFDLELIKALGRAARSVQAAVDSVSNKCLEEMLNLAGYLVIKIYIIGYFSLNGSGHGIEPDSDRVIYI